MDIIQIDFTRSARVKHFANPRNRAVVASIEATRAAVPAPAKRTSEPSLIPDIRKGDMVEVKSENASFTYRYDTLKKSFSVQLAKQVKAIELEGKGRRLFYCVGGNQTDANS